MPVKLGVAAAVVDGSLVRGDVEIERRDDRRGRTCPWPLRDRDSRAGRSPGQRLPRHRPAPRDRRRGGRVGSRARPDRRALVPADADHRAGRADAARALDDRGVRCRRTRRWSRGANSRRASRGAVPQPRAPGRSSSGVPPAAQPRPPRLVPRCRLGGEHGHAGARATASGRGHGQLCSVGASPYPSATRTRTPRRRTLPSTRAREP